MMLNLARRVLVAAAVLSQLPLASAQDQTSTKSIVLIPSPTAVVNPNTPIYKGCFSSYEPLEDHGPYLYQTPGNCHRICVLLNQLVFAVTDGNRCFCGDLVPANNTYVSDSECDTDCEGFDGAKCGGPKRWAVQLTAINKNRVDYYEPALTTTSAAASTAAPTKAPATVVISATPSPEAPSESRPNVAGIAAGVVVGVLALAGSIFGAWWYFRQRARREIEEEHKRQAAVNQFFSSGKSHHSQSSMGDSRLDPQIMQRRQSDGSIADNEDYSRRILKVTNPDGTY